MSYVIKARYANGQIMNLQPVFQCDTNVFVRVEGVEWTPGLKYVLEACNDGDNVVRSCEEVEPGLYKLDNDLLISGRELELYLYIEGSAWGRTIQIWKLLVKDRPMRGGVSDGE